MDSSRKPAPQQDEVKVANPEDFLQRLSILTARRDELQRAGAHGALSNEEQDEYDFAVNQIANIETQLQRNPAPKQKAPDPAETAVFDLQSLIADVVLPKKVQKQLDEYIKLKASFANALKDPTCSQKQRGHQQAQLKSLSERLEVIATKYNEDASGYAEKVQSNKALLSYQQALKIFSTLFGNNDLNVARTLVNMANPYREQAQYNQALKLQQRALKIYKTRLGADNLQVAATLQNMGVVYDEQANMKAIKFYLRAQRIYDTKLSADHPYVTSNLQNIAVFWKGVGAYARALKFFQRARKSYGANHPQMASLLNNMGNMYCQLAQYDHALEFYQQALKIYETKFSSNGSPDVALTLNNMAITYKNQGNLPEALEYYCRANVIYEQAFSREQPEHFQLAESRIITAKAHLTLARIGKGAEKSEHLKQAQMLLEKQLIIDNGIIEKQVAKLSVYDFKDYSRLLTAVSRIYILQGELDRAAKLYADRAVLLQTHAKFHILAIHYWRRALHYSPHTQINARQRAAWQQQLAELYAQQQSDVSATRYLQSAALLDSSNSTVKTRLAELTQKREGKIRIFDQDVYSQLESAAESYQQIQLSILKDLTAGKELSEYTKNRVTELIIKLRNLLDMSFARLVQDNVIDENQRRGLDQAERHSYYPIASSKANLWSRLGDVTRSFAGNDLKIESESPLDGILEELKERGYLDGTGMLTVMWDPDKALSQLSSHFHLHRQAIQTNLQKCDRRKAIDTITLGKTGLLDFMSKNYKLYWTNSQDFSKFAESNILPILLRKNDQQISASWYEEGRLMTLDFKLSEKDLSLLMLAIDKQTGEIKRTKDNKKIFDNILFFSIQQYPEPEDLTAILIEQKYIQRIGQRYRFTEAWEQAYPNHIELPLKDKHKKHRRLIKAKLAEVWEYYKKQASINDKRQASAFEAIISEQDFHLANEELNQQVAKPGETLPYDRRWLLATTDIANDSKHVRLTPQEVKHKLETVSGSLPQRQMKILIHYVSPFFYAWSFVPVLGGLPELSLPEKLAVSREINNALGHKGKKYLDQKVVAHPLAKEYLKSVIAEDVNLQKKIRRDFYQQLKQDLPAKAQPYVKSIGELLLRRTVQRWQLDHGQVKVEPDELMDLNVLFKNALAGCRKVLQALAEARLTHKPYVLTPEIDREHHQLELLEEAALRKRRADYRQALQQNAVIQDPARAVLKDWIAYDRLVRQIGHSHHCTSQPAQAAAAYVAAADIAKPFYPALAYHYLRQAARAYALSTETQKGSAILAALAKIYADRQIWYQAMTYYQRALVNSCSADETKVLDQHYQKAKFMYKQQLETMDNDIYSQLEHAKEKYLHLEYLLFRLAGTPEHDFLQHRIQNTLAELFIKVRHLLDQGYSRFVKAAFFGDNNQDVKPVKQKKQKAQPAEKKAEKKEDDNEASTTEDDGTQLHYPCVGSRARFDAEPANNKMKNFNRLYEMMLRTQPFSYYAAQDLDHKWLDEIVMLSNQVKHVSLSTFSAAQLHQSAGRITNNFGQFYQVYFVERLIYDWSFYAILKNNLQESTALVKKLIETKYLKKGEASSSLAQLLDKGLLELAKLEKTDKEYADKYKLVIQSFKKRIKLKLEDTQIRQIINRLLSLAQPKNVQGEWRPVLPLLHNALIGVENVLREFFTSLHKSFLREQLQRHGFFASSAAEGPVADKPPVDVIAEIVGGYLYDSPAAPAEEKAAVAPR